MSEDSSWRGGTHKDHDRGIQLAEALANERRVILLQCLEAFDEPVTLPDLADEIAIHESNREITAIPAEYVKEVYLSLYHTHIPKLAEAEIIEYDQEKDLVIASEQIDLSALFL